MRLKLKTNIKKYGGFYLLLPGIGIAVFAQLLLLGPGSTSQGLFLYVLAGLFFVLGLRSLGAGALPALSINVTGAPAWSPRAESWIISVGLAVMIAFYATRAAPDDRYGYFMTAAWVLSITLLVVSVVRETGWQSPSVARIRGWFNANRTELFVIVTILVAAFMIRFLDVELHPYSFINDEGHMGYTALCILQGKCTNIFNLRWAEQPQLAFLPYAISIGLLGKTALAVRLVSVIVGTLSTLAVYLFAREVFNRKIAWISAVLLSTLPVHVHFSRTGVDNIVDSLTAPLVLWLLFRGVKRASTLSFLAAGVIAGLCIYTYPGSLLAPVLGVFALAVMALQTRGFLQAHYRSISVFVLAAFVVALPMLGYYAAHSGSFLGRMKTEGILQNGILQLQMEATGKSAVEILGQQFAKSSLVFIAAPAPRSFFNSPQAYLPALEAVVFMLGLAYTLWRIKDPRCMLLFVWFWAVVILGSTLTRMPPANQRMLMSLPALAIMTAIGLAKTLEAFGPSGRPVARFEPLILLGLILSIGSTNLSFYFRDYRSGHYYEDVRNELTYETQFSIAPLIAQGRMYLIGNPDIEYLIFKSFDYFTPEVDKNRLNTITYRLLFSLPRDEDILFIALPDYKSDIELIAQYIPGGEWHEVRRRYQAQDILFYSYKLTQERLANFGLQADLPACRPCLLLFIDICPCAPARP